MMKKFLTVLVLGLAVFAISCSKEDTEVSADDIASVISALETSNAINIEVTESMTSKDLAQAAVSAKVTAVVAATGVKGVEAVFTVDANDGGTLTDTPVTGQTVIGTVQLTAASGYVFAEKDDNNLDVTTKTASITSTLSAAVTSANLTTYMNGIAAKCSSIKVGDKSGSISGGVVTADFSSGTANVKIYFSGSDAGTGDDIDTIMELIESAAGNANANGIAGVTATADKSGNIAAGTTVFTLTPKAADNYVIDDAAGAAITLTLIVTDEDDS